MHVDLDLPRSAWPDHPSYPEQVLLLRSHQGFRAQSRSLIERADAGGRRPGIVASFSWWKAAMHSHEGYEESKLYPFLEHRWGLDCDGLTAGHRALAVADAAVRATDDAGLAQALEAHHAVLMDHLDAEERLVIPALLALDRQEFEDYCDHGLRWLLAEVPCHAGEAGCRACTARATTGARRA
jgi:hypothetical protein